MAMKALLASPALPVRVHGETFHVHRTLLEQIPFFSAQLQGCWAEKGQAGINLLDCEGSDFALLLEALYARALDESAALPAADFTGAVGIAKASNVLSLELAGLEELLRACYKPIADTHAANEAQCLLPGSVGEVLRGLVADDLAALRLQVENAATAEACGSAEAVLRSCSSPLHFAAVAGAVGELLKRGGCKRAGWACRVVTAVLQLDTTADLSALLDEVEVVEVCSGHYVLPQLEPLHRAFAGYVQRRAEQGCDVRSLLSRAVGLHLQEAPHCTLRHRGIRHRGSAGGGRRACCKPAYFRPLVFRPGSSKELAAAARADSRGVAECLSCAPPCQLLEILDGEVIEALGENSLPALAALMKSPDATVPISWLGFKKADARLLKETLATGDAEAALDLLGMADGRSLKRALQAALGGGGKRARTAHEPVSSPPQCDAVLVISDDEEC